MAHVHKTKKQATKPADDAIPDGSISAVASGASAGVAVGAAVGAAAAGLPGIAIGAAIGGATGAMAAEGAVKMAEHEFETPKEKHGASKKAKHKA